MISHYRLKYAHVAVCSSLYGKKHTKKNLGRNLSNRVQKITFQKKEAFLSPARQGVGGVSLRHVGKPGALLKTTYYSDCSTTLIP